VIPDKSQLQGYPDFLKLQGKTKIGLKIWLLGEIRGEITVMMTKGK